MSPTLCSNSSSPRHFGTAFRIPVIDFTAFRTKGTSQRERKETADKIVLGFKSCGFIYLSGHSIPQEKIKQVFEKSAEFFRLPANIKDKLAWENPRSNRGYVKIGRERVTQSSDPEEIEKLRETAPDHKETMEIGRDWDAEWKNMWPSEAHVPLFRKSMLDFYQSCHDLHVDVMKSIALGLDLGEDFFDSKIDEQCHNLRLLSYPPIKLSSIRGEGQARAGAHSDYGTITLLFQDSVGGLEVQNPQSGEFFPASPVPETVIVNVGDLLARWSNDLLRSTLHRVVALPEINSQVMDNDAITPLRQSIAFFCNPNFGTEISCLPNCGREPKYEPVKAGEYIIGRLAETYI